MPEARVQLAIEIETEGAEQLTSLRRELEQLGQTGEAALKRMDASLAQTLEQLEQSRALVGSATQQFLDSHRRLFSSLDPVFQGFFRRLLGGTRSFSDALKRLLSDLLRTFVRSLEQMVAAWFGGFRRMSGGGSLLGGGGGGAFGILAPLISSGLGVAVSGTPPFIPQVVSGGAGLPAVAGLSLPGAGGGGGSATNLNLLSQLGFPLRDLTLGGLTLPGGLLASGGLLLGLSGVLRGSPVLGAAGGALAGFAFGGPIGAAIGAILGGLFGAFSRGKKKRQATRIAEAGFEEMRRVLEDFKKFQVDFESALAQVHAIWEQMVAGFRQIGGKVGRRSISTQEPHFRAIVAEIEQIQKLREARTNLIAALPIPEFSAGGFVRAELSAISSGQGKILAFLHQGEAVLNARAVASLGRPAIEQMNRAPSFQSGGLVSRAPSPAPLSGAGGVSITVQVFAAPGMNEESLANFTIRKLKRELRDRGISL